MGIKINIRYLISPLPIYIALLPVLFFPIISSVSIVIDWLFFDAERVLAIIHGPKTQILHEYLLDWLDSLLLSTTLLWLFFTPIYLFLKIKISCKKMCLLVAGQLIWLVMALFLYHFDLMGILLVCLSGLPITSGFIVLQNKSSCNQ